MSGLVLATYIALWAIVCMLTLLVILLYRQFGLMIMAGSKRVSLNGLDIGAAAPSLELEIGGTPASFRWAASSNALLRPGGTFALFAMPQCPLCERIAADPSVAELIRAESDVSFVWIDAGDAAHVGQLSGWVQTVSRENKAHLAMDIGGTPFGYVVDANGRVAAKGLVNMADDIARMLEQGLQKAPVVREAAIALSPSPAATPAAGNGEGTGS